MLFSRKSLANNDWPSPAVRPASEEGGFSSSTDLPPGVVIFVFVLSIVDVGASSIWGPPRVFYFLSIFQPDGEHFPICYLGRCSMGELAKALNFYYIFLLPHYVS